jgi:CheY-like chemotaxis protein
LLADDSVTIQRVIELTFADEDIQVVAVSDGDQAIARLEADPPDIVLADVGMPGRNGYEVAAYVKGSPRLAHIPVVLLTGAFEPVDQPRADSVGCDGVLAKPFEPQLVISRVKELLARPGRAPVLLDANLAPPASAASGPWASPLTDPPFAAPAPAARPAADDDYFDRLDAAFASLSSGAAPLVKPAASAAAPAPGASNPVADSIDWFAPKAGAAGAASAPAADLPLSYGSPQAEFARPPAPPPPAPLPPAPPPPAPAPRPTLPPLADAFAALLAAEQSAPAPPAAPQWPTPPASSPSLSPSLPPSPAAAPRLAVTDDLIEQVTHRVLERLSDQIVRDTVSEIVSATAERLVREEIERIKASIK